MSEVTAEASLVIALGNLATEMRSLNAHHRRDYCTEVQQVPLTAPQVTLTAGAGTLDIPDLLAAKTGYCWSIRRLVLTGWTAGSVTVYKNGGAAFAGGPVLTGEPLVPFPNPAAFTFGRGEMLLNPGDRIVVSATGITGYVQLNGVADAFEARLLARYLGMER